MSPSPVYCLPLDSKVFIIGEQHNLKQKDKFSERTSLNIEDMKQYMKKLIEELPIIKS